METTKQVKKRVPNPTGKGGFAERKDDISPGGWKKENVLSYQYKRFLNMTADEFEKFAKTPKSQMTMAEWGAFSRVKQLANSLPDAKEIADRTEGKAAQSVDVTSNGETLSAERLDDAELTARLEQIVARRQA